MENTVHVCNSVEKRWGWGIGLEEAGTNSRWTRRLWRDKGTEETKIRASPIENNGANKKRGAGVHAFAGKTWQWGKGRCGTWTRPKKEEKIDGGKKRERQTERGSTSALINGGYKRKIRWTKNGERETEKNLCGVCMNYGQGQIRRRGRLYS